MDYCFKKCSSEGREKVKGTSTEKAGLICYSTEFLSEPSSEKDIGCVPGPGLGKHWVRDENGKFPN